MIHVKQALLGSLYPKDNSSISLDRPKERSSRWRELITGLTISIALILSGCATTQPVEKHSGFLMDYSKLHSDAQDPNVLYYERANVDWKRYQRVMIDPVLIYYRPSNSSQAIQPDELKKLADYFHQAAIEAVQDRYPVVQKPASDVLRIRAAITDVVPSNVAANVLTAATVGLALDMGEASMEVEFVDASSGQPLGAIVARRKGTPIQMTKGFSRWSHAKDAFDTWAEELRTALDEVHGG